MSQEHMLLHPLPLLQARHSTEKYKIFGELLLPLAQKGHCFDQPL